MANAYPAGPVRGSWIPDREGCEMWVKPRARQIGRFFWVCWHPSYVNFEGKGATLEEAYREWCRYMNLTCWLALPRG